MLEGKPYFGLPGNPAATASTFELFVNPAMKRMAGYADFLPEKRTAVLSNEVISGGDRQAFLWCQLVLQDKGYRVIISEHQGSGHNRCLHSTNAILPVPVGSDKLEAGQEVEVLLLKD